MKKTTISTIKSNITKSQTINELVLKNIKGGRNCPPPWEVDNV